MYEINKVLSRESLAWGEGFFIALEDSSKACYDECMNDLNDKDGIELTKGWNTAAQVKEAHTRRLNRV